MPSDSVAQKIAARTKPIMMELLGRDGPLPKRSARKGDGLVAVLFFPLPLVGREGRSEAEARVGVSRNHYQCWIFSVMSTPTRPSLRNGHPPRAFAGEG